MKKICVDIDGVICFTKKNLYKNSKANYKVIETINRLYDEGHFILIYTARFMGRNHDNATLAKKKGYKFTKTQLNKWGLKFHKIYFGKPSSDLYIDDKNLNFKSNWVQDLKKILK